MAGTLGQAFGVCGNAYSPSDGSVVSMAYGCGAHSESVAETASATIDIVIDDLGYDDLGSHIDAEPEAPADPEPEATEPAAPADPEPPSEITADQVESQPADTEESP
jgi:hypothetical protein